MKILSLDVWGTLIEPNPEYSAARYDILESITIGADIIYKQTKRMLDNMAEATSTGLSSSACYKLLLKNLGSDENYEDVMDDMSELFWKHPPIIHPCTKEFLQEAHKQKYSLEIISNTNFIPGATLRLFLQKNVGLIFDYFFWSDECGPSHRVSRVTKPALISDHISYAKMTTHIGDSYECDYLPTKKVGANAILVNSPRCLDLKLLETINKYYEALENA